MLRNFLLVGLGGAVGAVLRFGLYHLIKTTQLPVATFLVNIIGSFLIGLLLSLGLRQQIISRDLSLFLTTGLCGGFTTFSTFSLENFQLLQSGRFSTAIAYSVFSILFGLLACYAGYRVAYST